MEHRRIVKVISDNYINFSMHLLSALLFSHLCCGAFYHSN